MSGGIPYWHYEGIVEVVWFEYHSHRHGKQVRKRDTERTSITTERERNRRRKRDEEREREREREGERKILREEVGESRLSGRKKATRGIVTPLYVPVHAIIRIVLSLKVG